jgi:RND family efflux transporter MFP subunit
MRWTLFTRTTLATLLAATLASCTRTDTPASAESMASVVTALAAQGSLSATAVSYGTVASAPRHTAIIAVLHDGIVKNIHVRNGEAVRAGAALVTIATAPTAVVQFAQARSALDFATQDLARIERLFADQLATNDQLATARKALSDAQAQFDQQHNMGADQAEEILRAPFDGVISGLSATLCDRLQANAVVGTLASRSDLIVQLGIEPAVATKLAPGAAVKLISPLDKSMLIPGKLASIGAMVDPTTRLVKAVVEIPAADAARVTLGTTLIAQVELPARSGIVIDRNALLEDAQGTYLFTVTDGKAHRLAVTILVETDDKMLVADGLATGTRVIVSGNAALDDGVAVREATP